MSATRAGAEAWASEVVALTGVIASGKSTVVAMLRELGAFCASADEFAREAVAPGSAGLAEVEAAFGPEALRPDGSLDRARVGQMVFADPAALGRLEAIVHPRVRELARRRFQAEGQRGWPLIVYEVPLLFETGLERLGFRSIVVVTAPLERIEARIQQRDGLGLEEARRRIASQIPAEEKVARADHVVVNDGDLPALRRQVEELFQLLKAEPERPANQELHE